MPFFKRKYRSNYRRKYGARRALKSRRFARPSARIAPGIYSGRGAYIQRVKRARGYGKYTIPKGVGRAIGSVLGGAAGAYLGAPTVGMALGGHAGDALQSLLKSVGIGDYKVESNSLLQGNSPPIIKNSSSGVIVRHREYLQNIVTASDGSFNLQSFAINPGLVSTFPWLSQVANAYEQYKLRGMIWEFKSTSADSLASTTTGLGSVIMATEYDSSRPVFQNQQQMANHEFANSSRQSCSMLHAIECKKSLTPTSELWVRSGAVPAGDDERLYDWGLFQIATVGGPSVANTIGELWVTYEVEFLKPQLISGIGAELLSDHYHSTISVSTVHYFGLDSSGSSTKAVSGSNLGTTISGNTIVFPPGMSEGTFMLIYICVGTSTLCTQPTKTGTNCAVQTLWNNDTSTNSSNNSQTVTTFHDCSVWKLSGQNATIAFSAGTLPASATDAELWIMQINGLIAT